MGAPMTEAEWLTGAEPPQLMVQALRDMGKVQRTKAGRRKLRLFGCGCCRLIWGRLSDPRLREAVEMAERFTEGLATKEELLARQQEAFRLTWDTRASAYTPEGAAARTALQTTHDQAQSAARLIAADPVPLACEPGGAEVALERLRSLLRCVFGNPFRPTSLDPVWLRWNGRAVVSLAQGVYEDRAFDRLPILADALEEAGCTDPDLLDHLRSPGPHVRGCWALDLILGKG